MRFWNTIGTSVTRKESSARPRISKAILKPAIPLANRSSISRFTAKNPESGSLTLTRGRTNIVAVWDTSHLVHGQFSMEPPRT